MGIIYENDNTEAPWADYGLVFKVIERGYGFKIAKEIVDRIGQANDGAAAPDYMVVKACSELPQMLRPHVRSLLVKLRQDRDNQALKSETDAMFRLWWDCHKTHYRLHKRALAEALKPKHPQTKKAVAV